MRDLIANYQAYSAAWKEPDAGRRDHLLDGCLADDGALFDVETPAGVIGPDALSEYIGRTQREMPGLVITESSEPQIVGHRLRVS